MCIERSIGQEGNSTPDSSFVFGKKPMKRKQSNLAGRTAELAEAGEVLRAKAALLEANMNSSLDGILVVDGRGKKALQNQRTADLWKIPQHIADDADDSKQLEWFKDAVKNREQFVERFAWLNAHPNEVSRDEIELKDGTVLDRYSAPVIGKDGEDYGRMWTFRDITERKRAQIALSESEEMLRRVMDSSQDCIKILDLEGRLVWMNEGGQSIMEIDDFSTVRNQCWVNFWPLEEQPAALAALEFAKNNKVGKFTGFCPTAKGSPHWWEVVVTPMLDEAGNPEKLLSVSRDITERKQAEKLLRQKDALIRIAGELTRTGGWALEIPDQRLFWSDEVFDILDFPRGNMPSLAEALALHPEPWRTKVTAAMETCVRDGTPFDFEMQILTAKGRQIWARVCAEVERHADGSIKRVQGAFQDISERKQAEETLRLLSSAVEQSKESILITDARLDLPGPGIIFVNPAFTQMTGYTAAEVIGATPRILQGAKTERAVLQRLRDTLARGEVFEGETVNYRKDGTEFQLEWQIAPIRNAAGAVTHFVAIQRDVTKRKDAEAERVEMNRQLIEASRHAGMAEVATSVLHNVGNVLNSVNISATVASEKIRLSCGSNVTRIAALLQEHRGDLPAFFASAQGLQLPDFLTGLAENLADEQRGVLAELKSLCGNIDHIKDIVEMQQTYARIAGVTEELAPASLIEDALRLNAAAFERHGVEVVREYGASPVLEVDKHKALQILVNLIRNAQYAMDESGGTGKRMTLKIAHDDAGLVKISVGDEGVGIPAENLTRIFEHGFTTRKDGHGFGLHSAVLAAKEMGGSLTAQSDGYGKGAIFTLALPLPAERSP